VSTSFGLIGLNNNKSLIFRLGFLVNPVKVTTRKLDYLFLNFINHFNKSETVKLTVAPIAAKTIVFKISSENKLGKMLNKVPAAVPVLREIVFSIYSEFISESFP
jgi:hypothetical protein